MLPGSELAWGLILGIVPEIVVGMVLWNKRLRKALRKDVREQLLADVDAGLLDPAIARATAGVDAAIGEVKENVSGVTGSISELKDLVNAEDLQAQIGTVQTRLEKLDSALEARLEKIQLDPIEAKVEELNVAVGAHLTSIYEGLEALPARLRSSLAGAQGAEMKELYKAATEAETEAIAAYESQMGADEKALAYLDSIKPSAEYMAKHEIGGKILMGVKELVQGELVARRGTSIGGGLTGKKKGPPKGFK